MLDTVPLAVQETYVLHDGPPYANGDLHIGKLRSVHVKSSTKVQAPSWTTSRISCSLLREIAHIHSALLFTVLHRKNQCSAYTQVFNALHNHQEQTPFCLHTGHALNKVLKDFILKFELLQGKQARYVPGWDCHGLPIELKVLQGMTDEQRRDLTTIKLRRKARDFALKAVNQQRESFKR